MDLTVLAVNNGIEPYSYTWTLNGNNAGNTQTITVPAGSPGAYQVTVQDACGGTGTVTIQVSPPNMPTLTLLANDVEIACLGGQVQLSVTATGGDGKYTNLWTDDSGTTVGYTATTNVIGTGDATFTVMVNDNCGQQTSTQMNVIAPDPLTLELPSMAAVCEGGSTVVSAEGHGRRRELHLPLAAGRYYRDGERKPGRRHGPLGDRDGCLRCLGGRPGVGVHRDPGGQHPSDRARRR
ncbi:MAG: hypothetical protein IPK99_09880 [Flavobacteriales bacterium]|nr:hypothetical protein [Flavobacteriales bacterium]